MKSVRSRGLWKDGGTEGADEFGKQFFLALWLVSIVLHDVLPDLNLLGGFQLEALGLNAVLDSVDGAVGEFVLSLLAAAHAVEGAVGLPKHEGCQCLRP